MSRGCRRGIYGFLILVLPSILWGGGKSLPRPSVDVQVEVTEVDNAKASSFGIEWLDKISLSERLPADIGSIGSFERRTPLQADIHFLVEEGAAELLANPNLLTDSGTTASFQAGGQIPYIVSASLGTTHVEFKNYGVGLEIRPRITKNQRIQVSLRASVSAPDRTNGVLLSGNVVPALFVREVRSNVTVNSGSTITLAGLVQTQKEEKVRGVPILRRIPLLGALFRWRTKQDRRSTIIIFVTPRIVNL